MKKILFTICLMAICGIAMAQDVKSYSVYDTNQSGDISISDLTEVVDAIKNNLEPSKTQQYIIADDINELLNTVNQKLDNIGTRLAAMEEKENAAIKPVFRDIKRYGHKIHIAVSGAIDLGLPSGTKWAACNLDASYPEQKGNLYAWGEHYPYYLEPTGYIEPVRYYDWISYFDSKNNEGTEFYKYTTPGRQLQPDDDAANIQLGSKWHIPTHSDFEELLNYCRCSFIGDFYLLLVTGRNGNTIVLPLTGVYMANGHNAKNEGHYWTSTLSGEGANKALGVFFRDGSSPYIITDTRCNGLAIRPVYKER